MCQAIIIGKDLTGNHISVEYERDASLRATEVVVVNKGTKTESGIRLICFDNGRIEVPGLGFSAETLESTDIV